MAGSKTKKYPRFYDLSIYTPEELVDLWSSAKAMEYKGLLAASLMNEMTHYTVLSRMVSEPTDVLSGDNVNWDAVELTEEILVSIIPMVDISQAGGALLVLAWIQWVKGRIDLARESFKQIDKETNFRSALVYVLHRKFTYGVQPAVMVDVVLS